MNNERDQLFNQPGDVADFSFDAAVARVFPDMIRRSVPGYDAQLGILGVIAARYAQPGTNLYDLGCSLGGATLAMRQQVTAPGSTIIAVDNAPEMLAKAQTVLEAAPAAGPSIQFTQGDVRNFPLTNASVVVFNYVLQFIPPTERLAVLQNAVAAMTPGAALIIAEKVPSAPLIDELHLDFKRANGYSELEIANKRTALENVMILDDIDTHTNRLEAAGLTSITLWHRSLNFVSLLALKPT